ncbi:hypothetical protein KPL71_026380 [Citrus sinensis]|uniref:Uncharacterized protein n=1 Tax=Citrus sinensis TaxID=2711 RepID=A0ACB8HZ19_CITSI|nr:hypothetical protein KPL71_026380 [Citrus sinensis]
MPLEWISNYEKFHTNTSPIQTTESMFQIRFDGTVRMTFRPPPTIPEEPPRLSFIYSAMVTAVHTAQEKLPITGFNSEGYPIYPAKLNGHFLWDSPGSGNCDPDCPCWDDWEEDNVEPQRKRKPKKKIPKTLCSHNQPKPPHNPPPPLAPLPIYQKELRLIAKNCKTEVLPHIQNSKPPIQPMACIMYSSTSQDYSSNFPALETQTDPQRKVITKPFIPSAITLTSHLEDPKPFEAVLNWQTQNARAQNETLVDIHKKQPSLYTPLPPQPTPTQAKDKSPMQQYSAQIIPDPSDIDQTSDSNLAVSEDPSESETESSLESSISFSDSEKSYADITRILMAQPEETEPAQSSRTDPFFEMPSDIEEDPPEASSTPNRPAQPPNDHKPLNGPWFTFDDIPAAKWRDRLSEMAAWTDLQMLRANTTTASVLRELATHFTGSLRDWFDTLGEYRQLQFVQLPNVSTALFVIHEQFIGESAAVFEAARRDYLNMKCCLLNSKDLDFHYKRMSILFYKLNGFNDPILKHVFLASLPEELQLDIQRQLTSLNLTIDNISLGKIFQIAKGCLEKLCEQKQFFKELLKDKEPFRSACKKPYLQIKCKKKKDCDCSTKKKKPFRKFKNPDSSPRSKSRRKSYRKAIILKIAPTKKEKAIRLLEHLQATIDYSPHKDEIEFYFSEQEEPTDETVFALQNSSDDSENDEFQTAFHQQLLSLDTTILIPSIKLQILHSKFQRSIPAIGLLNTEAQRSTQDDHRHLLNQFFDIIQSHGIMLSAKKSTIATNNIEFLRMTIKDGHYQLGKHIAQELIRFPNQHLSKRQIQQFLGIINYIRDFIPHVDHHTRQLSALLKKHPPSWNNNHTLAVTMLKQIVQNPPPLKLITDGRRIL